MPTRRAFLASAALAGATRGAAAEVPATGAADAGLAPFDKLFTTFLAEHKLPGAAVAVARGGRLAYARGFGHADAAGKVEVAPDALFRVASVSKPITAAAVLLLVDKGEVKLDDPVLKHVDLKPAGGGFDRRWTRVTVRQCLQHTGGWDRDRKGGFDPVGVPGRIARELKLAGPPTPDDVVRYMLGRPLDFDPGERFAYSNLGYLVLGRVIEAAAGERYEPWVKRHVFRAAGATAPALAKARPGDRPKGEVRYHDSKGRTGPSLYPPRAGDPVPLPDGAENVEAFEAHGGWVASAVDLVRFACALDPDAAAPLLPADARKELFARPGGADGAPPGAYYGCGWNVRPAGRAGGVNAWHGGLIAGTSALLVRRWDGLNWAVLFNTDADPDGGRPADRIDGPMHEAADAVRRWPDRDLFGAFRRAE